MGRYSAGQRSVLAFLEYLRRPRKGETGKVYLPKPILWLGVVGVALSLGIAVYTFFSREPLWIVFGFCGFALFSSILIIEYINDRILYDDTSFVSKNFFGFKRRFTYNQITAIKTDVHNRYIYLGDRKVTISEFAVGGSEFISFVKKKYKELHGGEALPKRARNTNDLFRGNVKDVSNYVTGYVIIILAVVGIFAFMLVNLYFSPKNTTNTIEHQRIFYSYTLYRDEVELLTFQEGYYKIRFTDHGFNPVSVQRICDEKAPVTVYSTEIKPDNGPAYYAVQAIVCDGEYVLSFDTTDELNRHEYRLIWIFLICLALAAIYFIGGSIVVGRNPQNFSPKTVQRFFKKEHLVVKT